jgi:hypothetical protein
VVEQYFETAEDMEVGGQAFSAMDWPLGVLSG